MQIHYEIRQEFCLVLYILDCNIYILNIMSSSSIFSYVGTMISDFMIFFIVVITTKSFLADIT